MRTYIFDGSFEGLVCMSVNIFKSREDADRVFIEDTDYQPVLFEDVIHIATEGELAEKAKRYIGKTLSTFALAWLYDDTNEHLVHLANCMADYYRNKKILEQVDKPHVSAVLKYARKTVNERHRMLEFVRFEELNEGVYFSEISPDADILYMLGKHFSARMPKEDDWMIYDTRRKKLLSHSAGKLQISEGAELTGEKVQSGTEEEYRKLWKVFFKSISIKERENLKLQQQHVSGRYRKYMTEFK